MRNYLISVALLCLAALSGCMCNSQPASPGIAAPVWIEEGIEHEGMKISLGQRGQRSDAERWVEPVAAITRDGKPVASAMVFSSLISADGTVIGDEAATVYESPGEAGSGLYTSGKLEPPAGSSPHAVRFRIVLPDVEKEWTRDVELR